MSNWPPVCPGQKAPFRLEPFKRPVGKREPSIFYTKGEYRPGVKITDWEKYFECRPIDIDPYCPGNLNYHLPHYKRLGNDPDTPWTTTTGRTLEQVKYKDKLNEINYVNKKYMVNYASYKELSIH